jgi:transcriptional regulator of acetoin/glycerol metabolism
VSTFFVALSAASWTAINGDVTVNAWQLKIYAENSSVILGCRGTVIHKQNLPFEILHAEHKTKPESFDDDKSGMLAALEKAKGSRTQAARLLGMSRATFYRRIEEYGIKPSK